MSHRLLGVGVATLMVVIACGGNAAPENSAPGNLADDTAWDRVLQGLDEDGVPLDTALQAFVLAIGDLPGVDVPEGRRVPIISGSGPLRWVLGHWEELSPEQQTSVTEYLHADQVTGSFPGPVLALTGAVLAAEPDEQALLGVMAQVEAEIAQNLGRELGVPIELRIAPKLVEGDALAIANGNDAGGGFFGPMAKCTVTITKEGLEIAGQTQGGTASSELTSLMAHEVFHCFEMALTQNLAQSYSRPPWVVEGLAAWVGETVAGGSEGAPWPKWLEVPLIPLFKREYSAIGFYAHLQEHGANMWLTVDEVILASDAGSEPAYLTAIAAGDDVLTTWGPGAYLDETRAPDWDQDGPGITGDGYTPQTAYPQVSNGTQIEPFAERLAADIWNTNLAAEVVTIDGTGYGMILLPDSAELIIDGGVGEILCTDQGGCSCPEGSPGASAVFRITSPGETRIGLTGHLDGTKLVIKGWSLDSFCEQEPELDECFVGRWETVSYASPPQEILIGTGTGIVLVIDAMAQGLLDFDPSVPIMSRIDDTPWVRVIQTGQVRFPVTPSASGAIVTTAVSTNYSIKGQVDLGSGFMDAGEGLEWSGPSMGPGATLTCSGDTLMWTAPGAVSEYEFYRESSEVEPLPAPPDDALPVDSQSGDGGGEGGAGAPPPPPPDWGLALDACFVLTLDEVKTLSPTAVQPATEDDISSQFLHQCTYENAFFLQVTPPQPPEYMETSASGLGLDIVVIEGVGDWARAFINQPDATFGTTDSVFMMAAGNEKGTVTLLPWNEIHQGTPEYEALVDLLVKALERI